MGHHGHAAHAETLNQFIAGMSDIPPHHVKRLNQAQLDRLDEAAKAAAHFNHNELAAIPGAIAAVDLIDTHRAALMHARLTPRDVLDTLSHTLRLHRIASADLTSFPQSEEPLPSADLRRLGQIVSSLVELDPEVQAKLPTVPPLVKLAARHLRQLEYRRAGSAAVITPQTAASIRVLADSYLVADAARMNVSANPKPVTIEKLKSAAKAASRLPHNTLFGIKDSHAFIGRMLEMAPKLELSDAEQRSLRQSYSLHDLKAVTVDQTIDAPALARGATAFAVLSTDKEIVGSLYWAMPRVAHILSHRFLLRDLVESKAMEALVTVPLEQAKQFEIFSAKKEPSDDKVVVTEGPRRGKKNVTSPKERAERIVSWLEPLQLVDALPAAEQGVLIAAYGELANIGNYRRHLNGALPLTTQQHLATAAKSFAALADIPSEARAMPNRMGIVRVMARRLPDMASGLIPAPVEKALFSAPIDQAYKESQREAPDQTRMIALLEPLAEISALPHQARLALADAYRLTESYQLAQDQYDQVRSELKAKQQPLSSSAIFGAVEAALLLNRAQVVPAWLAELPQDPRSMTMMQLNGTQSIADRLSAVAELSRGLKAADPSIWTAPLLTLHRAIRFGRGGELIADFEGEQGEGRVAVLPLGRGERPQLVMPLVHVLAEHGHVADAARLIDGLDARYRQGLFAEGDQVAYTIERGKFSEKYGAAVGLGNVPDRSDMARSFDGNARRRAARDMRREEELNDSPILGYFLNRGDEKQPLRDENSLSALVDQYPDDRVLARELAKLLRSQGGAKKSLEAAHVLLGQDFISPEFSPADISPNVDPDNMEADYIHGISVEDYLHVAKDLRAADRSGSAAVVLGALIERCPDNEEVRLNLAHALSDTEHYPQAAEHYLKLLDSPTHAVAAYAGIAEAQLLMNDPKGALKFLGRLKIEEGSEPLGRLLAVAQFAQGLRSDNIELAATGLSQLPLECLRIDREGIALDFTKGKVKPGPDYKSKFTACYATFVNVMRLGEALVACGYADYAYTHLYRRAEWALDIKPEAKKSRIDVDGGEDMMTRRGVSTVLGIDGFACGVYDRLKLDDPGSEETRRDIVRAYLVGGKVCIAAAEKVEEEHRNKLYQLKAEGRPLPQAFRSVAKSSVPVAEMDEASKAQYYAELEASRAQAEVKDTPALGIWRMAFRYLLTAYKLDEKNPEVLRVLNLPIGQTGDKDMIHAVHLQAERHRKDAERAAEERARVATVAQTAELTIVKGQSMQGQPERRPTRPSVGAATRSGVKCG